MGEVSGNGHAEHKKAGEGAWAPEPEGGPSAEENRLGLGLGLFQESEEGVVLHTDLPEGLAEVSAGHQELQGVLVGALAGRQTAFIFPAQFIVILLKRG